MDQTNVTARREQLRKLKTRQLRVIAEEHRHSISWAKQIGDASLARLRAELELVEIGLHQRAQWREGEPT